MKNTKFEWPEHATRWEKNQAKVLIALIIVFFGLLSIVRYVIRLAFVNPLYALIWLMSIISVSTLLVLLFPGSKD